MGSGSRCAGQAADGIANSVDQAGQPGQPVERQFFEDSRQMCPQIQGWLGSRLDGFELGVSNVSAMSLAGWWPVGGLGLVSDAFWHGRYIV